MANKPLNISEEAAVQMPMKTVASLIYRRTWHDGLLSNYRTSGKVADTRDEIMEKDLES